MPPQSHIARALEELIVERDHLAARLVKVENLITEMRDVFHLRAERPALARQRPRAARSNGNGHAEISADAIRAALAAGPVSPGDLALHLGISRHRLRANIARLESQGLVVSSGSTANRQIALAGKPAKEVP